MPKRDPALTDPDGHFPYARDRAEAAGLPAELVDVSERIVKAETACRLDPFDEDAKAEYAAAVAEARAINERRRPAVPTVTGDAKASIPNPIVTDPHRLADDAVREG